MAELIKLQNLGMEASDEASRSTSHGQLPKSSVQEVPSGDQDGVVGGGTKDSSPGSSSRSDVVTTQNKFSLIAELETDDM